MMMMMMMMTTTDWRIKRKIRKKNNNNNDDNVEEDVEWRLAKRTKKSAEYDNAKCKHYSGTLGWYMYCFRFSYSFE